MILEECLHWKKMCKDISDTGEKISHVAGKKRRDWYYQVGFHRVNGF